MSAAPGAPAALRSPRVLLMLSLGFASGLPYQLTGSTLSAWMSSAGVPLGTVGLFALVSLPYSAKVLWAPFLDRYRLPLLGRRRGWMVACQLALIAAVFALGQAGARPQRVAALAVLVAALSASQDIASDAYRADLLAPAERPVGTATFILGYRLALLVSGGLALVLSDHLPFPLVYALMALGLLIGVVATVTAPEPPPVAAPRSLAAAVVAPLRELFGRRGAVALLLFVALYRVGDLVASGVIVPFLLSLRFTRSEIGVGYKIAGTAATLLGTLGGGLLVTRLGAGRALLLFGLMQGAANLGYAALAVAGHRPLLMLAAVALDQLCTGLAIAALDALLVALCDRRFSATQFALLTSLSGVLGRLAGAQAGYLAAWAGWPWFFAATALLSLPALPFLLALPPVSPREVCGDRSPPERPPSY